MRNMNSILGDDELVPWPLYTSRLDIEPELAVVYGNADQPVAGYYILTTSQHGMCRHSKWLAVSA